MTIETDIEPEAAHPVLPDPVPALTAAQAALAHLRELSAARLATGTPPANTAA